MSTLYRFQVDFQCTCPGCASCVFWCCQSVDEVDALKSAWRWNVWFSSLFGSHFWGLLEIIMYPRQVELMSGGDPVKFQTYLSLASESAACGAYVNQVLDQRVQIVGVHLNLNGSVGSGT